MNLFEILYKLDLNYKEFEWLKENQMSDFDLLISVILTQNTKWQNVLKALNNLKNQNINSLNDILNLNDSDLALLIKPSGFYNTKAKRIKNMVKYIKKDFSTLENFKENVNRSWLLNIKGLGSESVDSILNYLCDKEYLVVDAYTYRLALVLGYELQEYEELQDFFQNNILQNYEEICKLLNKNLQIYELYQIFHALIIAFCKKYFKGKNINEDGKKHLKNVIL